MKFFNATQGRANLGWFDGLKNIPAEWGMEKVRLLYSYDFYPPGADRWEPPDKDVVKALAIATQSAPYVVINIEGWEMFLPGEYYWDPGKWALWSWPPTKRFNSAEEWNDFYSAAKRDLLKIFKKWNTTSQLGWYAHPQPGATHELYFDKYADRGYRGPDVSGYFSRYQGAVGTDIWQISQFGEHLDFGVAGGYWAKASRKNPEQYTFYNYAQDLNHGKTVTDVAIDGPLMVFIRPIEVDYKNPEPDPFIPATLWQQITDHLDSLLCVDDGVALWEGYHVDLELLDSQLADVRKPAYWIEHMDRWIKRHQ